MDNINFDEHGGGVGRCNGMNTEKFTKIVATVSDKRCETEFVKSLYEAGVNVVRMNSAHLDYDGFKKIVANTRSASERIALMMDTKGREVRTTVTATGEAVEFVKGQTVIITETLTA